MCIQKIILILFSLTLFACQDAERENLSLERFGLLGQTLENELSMRVAHNIKTFEDLEDKWVNKKEHLDKFTKLRKLRGHTESAVRQLAFAKLFIYNNIGGGINSTSRPMKNPKEHQKVKEYLLGNEKRAGELASILLTINALESFVKQSFPNLKLSSVSFVGKNSPNFVGSNALQGLSFPQYRAYKASAVEALCMIVDLQLRTLQLETVLQTQIN